MKTSTAATQPPADQLLDHNGLAARLELLATRPGTHLKSLGRSLDGRDIFLVTLSDTDDPAILNRYRQRARHLARPSFGASPPDELALADAWPEGVRLPVLFAGSSFGDEAAHVEALVELADLMAHSQLFDRIVLLIVPLMNPDGRERAIVEWADTPGSSGSAGEGNARGQLLNRDFLYASQPETEAMNRLLNEWDPLVIWDAHEDAVSLGRKFEEVCLAPPTAPHPPPGITPALETQVRRFGGAIASVWGEAGFNQLYHPEGLHGWTAPEDGAPTRMTGFIGRLAYAAGLRGTIAFITESARTVGVQSWDDRLRQKVLAGQAVARHGHDHAGHLVAAVAANRLKLMREHENSFYVLPQSQDQIGLENAVRVMRSNGIALHQTVERDAVVVLGRQPNVSSLLALGGEFAPHDGLRLTSNVQMISARSMDESERAGWLSRELVPFESRPVGNARAIAKPSGRSRTAAQSDGRRRVAVYCDVGVTLREGSSGGSVAWLLAESSVPFETASARDVADGRLRDFDILIVPNGNAKMIVGGYGIRDTWYGSPWSRPAYGQVLTSEGQDALAQWIRAGGTYIGVDAGGGWLATQEHLGLIDATRFGADLGLGAVDLHITQPQSELFAGCSGSYGPTGDWRPNMLHVPYGGEGHRGAGSAYEVGDGVVVLARYGAAHSIPGIPHLVNSAQLAGAPAIIEQPYGAGRVILFGFDPSFRCYWSSTFPLLLSAAGVRK